VFFRAVNVGGHQKFQPSAVARALKELHILNIGAAGTFVVSANKSELQVRKRILGQLRFTPELMICRDADVLALEKVKWPEDTAAAGVLRYVTILAGRPARNARLPIRIPDSDDWQISVVVCKGPFVLSVRRPGGAKLIYPNEIVEKAFGVHATTRNWTTITKICDILRATHRSGKDKNG
jgi:uncharacterized protein (DUF1697 family)